MAKLSPASIRNALAAYHADRADRAARRHEQKPKPNYVTGVVEYGIIRLIHPTAGYGFLTSERDGADIWCPPNALPPFELEKGTRVFYHRKPSTHHKGQWVAFNVTPAHKWEEGG